MRTNTMVVIGLLMAAGCASSTRAVEHRYHRESVATATPATAAPATTTEHAAVVEQSTTVKETPEERGLLSSIVHVVGEILSLPFRLVGGLIRMVF